MRKITISLVLVLCAISVSAAEVYRWVDKNGRVQYSDQPPPAGVKKSEQRKIGENVIDGQDAYPLKQAIAKNPVLLYTGDCGQLCASAKALLIKRGIPHAEKDPQNNKADADALMDLVRAMEIPALKVGNKAIKGFDANRWNAALDEAGYPTSNPPLRKRKTDTPLSYGAIANPAAVPSPTPASLKK